MPKKYARPAEAWTYVLYPDRALPLDQQSRFTLRPLTQAEKLAMLDGLNWVNVHTDGTQEVMPRAYSQALELCLSHIDGVENFPNDGPIAWPAKGSDRQKADYLAMLSDMDILELGNEIRYHAQPLLATPAPVSAPPAEAGTPQAEAVAAVPNS
jgi:hypothetical protein